MSAATQLLHDLCSVPTAPFVEERVVAFVRKFVAARKRVRVKRDEIGNLLLTVPGKKPGGDRMIFTAHLDHPGFVAKRMIDPKTVEADFRGGVRPSFFDGSRVRFFQGDAEIRGTVISHETEFPDRPSAISARIRVAKAIRPGTLGMWDIPPARESGGMFHGRVCDDLAGAAAALQMLDDVAQKPANATIGLLLTRGEEEGFIGALGVSMKPNLLKKTDRLIAIECSSMQPYAPQGAGPIIRVGDRTSVFDSDLTYFLTEQANALVAADKDFKFQRALMPGGTCEATVYCTYGFRAASICLSLGNYHNMDMKGDRIGPETVSVADWLGMVRLFTQIARQAHRFEPGMQNLKSRLEKRYTKFAHLL